MLSVQGSYNVDVIRKGKIYKHLEGKNTVTYEGLSRLLNSYFRYTTDYVQSALIFSDSLDGWYCGLIREKSDLSETVILPTYTGKDHDFELFTDFSETYLPQWRPPLATWDQSGELYNATAMSFNITGTPPRLLGMYIKQTKEKYSFYKVDGLPETQDPCSPLWAATLMAGCPLTVVEGDRIDIFYSVKIGIQGV